MPYEKFLFKLAAELLKIHFKGKKLKKDIKQAVNDAITKHSEKLDPLCMDKAFAEKLFELAGGKTINAKDLRNRGVEVSNERGFGFSEDEIAEELYFLSLTLTNIFEEIAPEAGVPRRPGSPLGPG